MRKTTSHTYLERVVIVSCMHASSFYDYWPLVIR